MVLTALVIVAAAAALAWLVGRAVVAAGRDARSLVGHHDALERLHELCDRNAGPGQHADVTAARSHVRLLAGAPSTSVARPAPPPLRLDPPAGPFGGHDDGDAGERPAPADPLAGATTVPSGDAGGAADRPARPERPAAPAATARRGAAPSRAGAPPWLRPAALTGGALALVAAVTITLVSPPQRRGPATATRSEAPSRRTPLTPPAPVVTTAAPATVPAVVTVTTAPGLARYAVRTTPVRLTLRASALCWLRVREGGPSGRSLFEGLLRAGEERTFEGSALWLRVGKPGAITASVGGTVLDLPAPSGRVLTLVVTGEAAPATP